ncbi:hypothetical protein ACU6WZ_26905 [Streptomyces hypolithicus]
MNRLLQAAAAGTVALAAFAPAAQADNTSPGRSPLSGLSAEPLTKKSPGQSAPDEQDRLGEALGTGVRHAAQGLRSLQRGK